MYMYKIDKTEGHIASRHDETVYELSQQKRRSKYLSIENIKWEHGRECRKGEMPIERYINSSE